MSLRGFPLERYEYVEDPLWQNAYGNPTIRDAQYAIRNTSLYGNPYLFTASRVDILDSGSLKIQYNRNRYYPYYLKDFCLGKEPGAYPFYANAPRTIMNIHNAEYTK